MKKTIYVLTSALGLLMTSLTAQVTTNVDPSAALEIESTTKGFLPPRMSTAQRNAITNPAEGLLIYNISTQNLNFYNGIAWVDNFCAETGTGTVLSSTGKTWLSKNLGANQIAAASNDEASYGHLYQWGRNSDGHQFRTSSTAPGPVPSDSEGSNFITNAASIPYDWLSTPDDTRWNGSTKGAHDPCPTGFRVPTETELENERLLFSTKDAAGAFASVLKLPLSGYRYSGSPATLLDVGSSGYYWSSTVDGTNVRHLFYYSNNMDWASNPRAYGFSVRCIKE